MIGPIWQEPRPLKVGVELRDQNKDLVTFFSGMTSIEEEDGQWCILVQGQNLKQALTIRLSEHSICCRSHENTLVCTYRDPLTYTQIEFQNHRDYQTFIGWLESCIHDTEPSLPFPDIENLNIFHAQLVHNLEHFLQCFYANPEEYLDALCATFNELESTHQTARLPFMFAIAKDLFLSNQEDIIEMITENKYFAHFLGMFENHPDNQNAHRMNFREIYLDRSHFKQLFNIEDETTLHYIHQNFKLQFINDVVLASYLQSDEFSASVISRLISSNNVRIVKGLLHHDRSGMVKAFSSMEVYPEEKAQFLTEFINVSKAALYRFEEFKAAFIETCKQSSILQSLFKVLPNPTVTAKSKSIMIDMVAFILALEPEFALEFVHSKQETVWQTLLTLLDYRDLGLTLEVHQLAIKVFGYASDQHALFEQYQVHFLAPLWERSLMEITQAGQPDYTCFQMFCDQVGCHQLQQLIRSFLISHRVLRSLEATCLQSRNTLVCMMLKFLHYMLCMEDEVLIKHIKQTCIVQKIAQIYKRRSRGMVHGALYRIFKTISERPDLRKLKDSLKDDIFNAVFWEGFAHQASLDSTDSSIQDMISHNQQQYVEEPPLEKKVKL